MSRRYRVRQSPALSGFAAIGSIVFLFAGCVMMNPGDSMAGSAPMPFQLLWVIACIASFCVSIYNAVSDQGIATDIIQEDFTEDENGSSSNVPDTASMLRELEKLRAENLISEEEFQTKRAAVLARFE